MPHDRTRRPEHHAVADGESYLAAAELADVQSLASARRGPLAEEGAIRSAEILELEAFTHTKNSVFPRDGGIVDANHIVLRAADCHGSVVGQFEGTNFLSEKDD